MKGNRAEGKGVVTLLIAAFCVVVALSLCMTIVPWMMRASEPKAGQVVAPQSTSPPDRQELVDQRERDELWVIHMESKVRERLKDPDSATFRGTRTFHGGGAPVACGEVNSKNGFGGMGGYQRFVAAGDIIALEEQVEGGLQETWDQFCRE